MTNPVNTQDTIGETSSYTIRPMSRTDLNVAIAWAATEGWNPGLHDAASFYNTDPGGFLMGWLKDTPIASISAVRYGEGFGFIGFYIVRSEYRGQGYGFRLWQAGMDHLQGRIVGLDGVVEQQANYQKSGFQLAHRNIRYEGIEPIHQEIETFDQLSLASANVLELNTLDQSVLNYDQAFFPDKRTEFLRQWLTQPESYSVGLMQQGNLVGYGVVRPCQTGYKVGPLFANSSEDAELLFLKLRQHIHQRERQQRFHDQGAVLTYRVYLDVPEPNRAAVALAQRYQMTPIFETARMYTAPAPELPVEQIFGITTFELG
ncbi:MAG: GNAT family N-acetyltransferase [Cyanobacteria bacterium P01_F01_bin.150]